MRNIRRFMSLILVAAMCLCMVPTFADAADAPVISGTITITTTDSVTNEPISGASYKLERLTAGIYSDLGTGSSGANGVTTFSGALTNRAGWYRVIQTAVPSGYELNSAPQIVHIDAASPSSSLSMKNTQDMLSRVK